MKLQRRDDLAQHQNPCDTKRLSTLLPQIPCCVKLQSTATTESRRGRSSLTSPPRAGSCDEPTNKPKLERRARNGPAREAAHTFKFTLPVARHRQYHVKGHSDLFTRENKCCTMCVRPTCIMIPSQSDSEWHDWQWPACRGTRMPVGRGTVTELADLGNLKCDRPPTQGAAVGWIRPGPTNIPGQSLYDGI